MTAHDTSEVVRKYRRRRTKDRQALFIAKHSKDLTVTKTIAKAILNCTDPLIDEILKRGLVKHWRDNTSRQCRIHIETASLLEYLEKECNAHA